MKKIFTLIALTLISGSVRADFWDNCTAYGGTIITANKYGDDKGGLCNDPNDSTKTNNCNGKKFCYGGSRTNWWSAFTWCEAISGHLASFGTMCPGIQTNANNTAGACPNLTGVGSESAWSNLGRGTSNVFDVNLSTGGIGSLNTRQGKYANTGGKIHPFCEE
jgi:hypothetical protein